MGQKQSTINQIQTFDGLGLYVETTKDIFLAGNYIQGNLYLKTDRPILIEQIRVNFACKQSINIVEGLRENRENRVEYEISGITYEDSFKIKSFDKTKPLEGSFIFPFKLLIPAQLPGSYHSIDQRKNFICYFLSAQTQINDSPKKIVKSNKFTVHVEEPFRLPLQSIDDSETNYPQCCNCCQSYGVVYVKLKCDKNCIKGGQKITVFAEIDNTHGKIPVRNARVRLSQHLFIGSPMGSGQHFSRNELNLGQFDSQIPNGSKKNITFTKTVPQTFSQHSTAIGNILANYYTIGIASEMGICSLGANISSIVFYQASNPSFEKNVRIGNDFLKSTQPKRFPETVITKMKDYEYAPARETPWFNRQHFDRNFKQKKYEITKKSIADKKDSTNRNQDSIKMEQRKEAADPQGLNSAAQRPKYMDQEDQADYDEFKDFKSVSSRSKAHQ